MPYTIYVLDEDDISLTNADGSAQGLDGQTQGNGSHLVNDQLVLNAPNWQPVEINDNAGDNDFGDSDISGTNAQRLANDTEVNGTTFTAGTTVEAEFSFVVTDGTNTWTLVGFNITNGSPAYATVEGLAFIGPPGGFPPTGVPLTVVSAQEGPNFAADDYATPLCFGPDTLIDVPGGARPVREIAVGDLVLTESGPAPVRWHGVRVCAAEGRLAPVIFAPGAIGNARELVLSPQHRLAILSPAAEMLFGAPQVLVPAIHFEGRPGVSRRIGGTVEYHHLMLDGHRTLTAEGVAAESLHAGRAGLASMSPDGRREILEIFPHLALTRRSSAPPAAATLKRHESRLLFAA